MERREQYDPEDIESLLQERSFDELLEEERAYVLRHLSGREEYEQMRALLRHVREREHQPIEADDRVRENVMRTFRSQQRPQWRIWLNSIGGILAPGEGFAFWRPALALGMLVILFGIGIYLVRGPIGGGSEQQLAEVRQKKAEEPIKKKEAEVSDQLKTGANGTEEAEAPELSSATATPAKPERPPAPGTPIEMKKDEAAFAEVLAEDADLEFAATREPTTQEEQIFSAGGYDTIAPASGHVVTQEELYRNQSLANASGQVKARSVQESEKPNKGRQKGILANTDLAGSSRSVSRDPVIMDLLSAGW